MANSVFGGQQGPQGPAGPTGPQGDPVAIDDEGTPVAGSPHDTLDFVGAGVTVTDAGGGTATVTIPGGGAGDVTAAVATTNDALVFGDTPTKGIKTVAAWVRNAINGLMGTVSGVGWALEVFNTLGTGGGGGLHVRGGEIGDDLAVRIADADDTFTLLEMHADQGYNVLGTTYAAAEAATPGLVHGWDIRHGAGRMADFNTQNGIYRRAGNPFPFGSNVGATGLITTGSTTHVLAAGMSITPPAGTYMVTWAASVSNTDNSAHTRIRIYAGGVAQSVGKEAERGDSSTDNIIGITATAKVVVNGSQAIEGRYRAVSGTAEMYGRSLMIVEVAG